MFHFRGTPRWRIKCPFYTLERREKMKIFHRMRHQVAIWCDIRCKNRLENYGCGCVWAVRPWLTSEEDKRATTNVQHGWVFVFLFSFILFSYFWTKTAVKPLNSKKTSWRQNSEKLWKKVWKCVENCQKVWKSAETMLPFSCCPLVFLWLTLTIPTTWLEEWKWSFSFTLP